MNRQERFILFSSALGLFLYSLDSSLMNMAQPIIARQFGTGTSEVSFISTAYLVSAGSCLMIASRLLEMLDFKRVLLGGYGLFLLSTLACGLSGNLWVLVACRLFQGVGGSVILTGAFSAAGRFLPAKKIGTALGVLSASLSGGMAAGFPLGGLLTAWFPWQSVFFLQVPFIVLSMVLAGMAFPSSPGKTGGFTFDIPGVTTFFMALASLTFSLSMGENLGWTSPAILGGFLAALLLFPVFFLIESRSRHPFLNPGIFRDTTYSLFVGGRVMATLFQSGNLFLLPFYLVCLLKLSQTQAGLVMLSYTVLYTCLAPVSGLLADRFKPERVGFVALLLLFCGCLFFLARVGVPSIPWVVGFLLLVSAGFAVFFPSNNKLSILFVPPESRGLATGLMLTVWAIGQSLGVSLFELVFSTRLGALSPDTLSGKWNLDKIAPDVLIASFRSAYVSGTLTILFSLALTGLALLRMNRSHRS